MAANSLRSILVTLVVFALVFSPLLPCDAVRITSPGFFGPKRPICPACVCCQAAPPGSCCSCCASTVGPESQNESP
ncbi:hypothetical protein SLE2022_384250 [Rubroshorea leprosula]